MFGRSIASQNSNGGTQITWSESRWYHGNKRGGDKEADGDLPELDVK